MQSQHGIVTWKVEYGHSSFYTVEGEYKKKEGKKEKRTAMIRPRNSCSVLGFFSEYVLFVPIFLFFHIFPSLLSTLSMHDVAIEQELPLK